MKKVFTTANSALFEVSPICLRRSFLGYHSQILHLPHGRTFHCLRDIPLCSSHTEHKEQGGRSGEDCFFSTRWQSEEERRRADDGNRVRHQKVQVFDYSHFLALPLPGIHSVIKSSFVLFPQPSPSQLISHLTDALVIKTIIVILWHIYLIVNSLSWWIKKENTLSDYIYVLTLMHTQAFFCSCTFNVISWGTDETRSFVNCV